MKTLVAAVAMTMAAGAASACEIEHLNWRGGYDGTFIIMDGVVSDLGSNNQIYIQVYGDENYTEFLGRNWTYIDPDGGFTLYIDVTRVPQTIWLQGGCG